ncbi:MAG: hypothetical protein JNM10_02440, partial [Planctomycetia bacterium]|nr:hypothetical protein [Planctomycetia bacterium]
MGTCRWTVCLVLVVALAGAPRVFADPPLPAASPGAGGITSDEAKALEQQIAELLAEVKALRAQSGAGATPGGTPAHPSGLQPKPDPQVIGGMPVAGASVSRPAVEGPATGLRIVVPGGDAGAPSSGGGWSRSGMMAPYASTMRTGEGSASAWEGGAYSPADLRTEFLRADVDRIYDVGRVDVPAFGSGGRSAAFSRVFSPSEPGTGFRRSGDGGYYTVEGADPKPVSILEDVLTVFPAKGKLGLLLSDAKNGDLKSLHRGDTDFQHKGFNANVLRVDAALKAGQVGGEIAAEYYQNHGDDDDEILLQEAYAKLSVPGSLPDRFVLKLGEITQPLGLNGGKKWMDAVWPEMPTIYGRVLPNNFNGTGIGLDWRVTDWGNAPTNVDSVLSIAVVNADGKNLSSFLGETNPVFGVYSRTEKDTRSLLGELAYGARSTTAIAIGSSVVVQFGGSFATGPNGVGEKGQTWFYGAHARLMISEFALDACNRCVRDGGFVLSGEWLHRRLLVDQGGTFPRAHLDDWGYT